MYRNRYDYDGFDSSEIEEDVLDGRFSDYDNEQNEVEQRRVSWNCSNVETVAGATGPMGPRGQRGAQGPRGIQGPQGREGLQGLRGPQGVTGVQGPAGEQGEIGPVGPQGEQGERGVSGPCGPIGPTGMQGATGATGPAGEAAPGYPHASASLYSYTDKQFCSQEGFVFDIGTVPYGFTISDDYQSVITIQAGTYIVNFGCMVSSAPCYGDAVCLELNHSITIEESRIPLQQAGIFTQGTALLELNKGDCLRMVSDSDEGVNVCSVNNNVNAYLIIYQIN